LLLEEFRVPSKFQIEKDPVLSSDIIEDSSSSSSLSLSRHNSTTTTIVSDSSSPHSSPRGSLATVPLSLDLSGSSRSRNSSNNSPIIPPNSPHSMSYLSSLPLASPQSIGSRPVRNIPINFIGPAENFPKATAAVQTTLPHHYPTIFKDSTTLPVLSNVPTDPPPTPPRPSRTSLSTTTTTTSTTRSPSPSHRRIPQLPPRPKNWASQTPNNRTSVGSFAEPLSPHPEEPESNE